MVNPPPGGLPSWLQLLPPNLTIPFNAIQQAIDDFVRGLQPATVLPRDDDGVLRDPVLPREDPIIRDPMPDPQPTIIRDPILPQEDPILRDPILPREDPIIRDIFPRMEGGGIIAATDDDDDSAPLGRQLFPDAPDEMGQKLNEFLERMRRVYGIDEGKTGDALHSDLAWFKWDYEKFAEHLKENEGYGYWDWGGTMDWIEPDLPEPGVERGKAVLEDDAWGWTKRALDASLSKVDNPEERARLEQERADAQADARNRVALVEDYHEWIKTKDTDHPMSSIYQRVHDVLTKGSEAALERETARDAEREAYWSGLIYGNYQSPVDFSGEEWPSQESEAGWTQFLADNVETRRVVDTVVNEVLDRRWAGDPTGLAKGLFDPDTGHAREVAREIEHGAAWEGLPDDEWNALRETQQHADPVTEEQLEKIKAALYDKTQEFFKSLPDEVTIYRFGPQREDDPIASFTLNPGYNYLRDLPWAERAQAQGEQFLTYKVDKKDILFYTDMRGRSGYGLEDPYHGGEQEIFVDFSKVRLDENAPPLDPPEWRGINPT